MSSANLLEKVILWFLKIRYHFNISNLEPVVLDCPKRKNNYVVQNE